MPFHLDGVLFRDVFGTAELRDVLAERGFVERFLEVEAALARAEAEFDVIPGWAAEEITASASLDSLDMSVVEENVADVGLFSLAIVDAWKEELGEAGEYVHWGATTQDVSDTAMVLQLRDALDVLLSDLLAIRDRLADLAREHRETPMIGRTQHVHAPPITFGFKAATWLDEIDRHVARLADLRERALVVEFFGASGTLAAVEDHGIELLETFAAELDLAAPDIAWTASRDRFATVLNAFATVAGTASRIAQSLLRLNRAEFGEFTEPVPDSEVGSSTNPHKRNPVYSQHVVALARLVRACAGAMTEATDPADERDRGAWYVEFAVVPEATLYLGRVVANLRAALEGLQIHPEAMAENLRLSGALVASEAVMIELAESVGRQTAHEVVHELAMEALDTERDFETCLREDPRVREHLSADDIDRLTDPSGYTGLSEEFVDRVLESVSAADR